MLAALAASLVLPAAATASDAASTLAVQLTTGSPERKVLSIRGTNFEQQDPGKYSVTATLLQIPCPGTYHFLSEGQNLENGNSNSYSATIKLRHFVAVPVLHCGTRLPSSAGKATVLLAGPNSSTPLHLKAARPGPGVFSGKLTLKGLPECDVAYTLTTRLDLRGWHYALRYQVVVRDGRISQQGQENVAPGC